MAVSISGDGAVTGVASINTDVSSTELGYLDGVTSAIQPQIAGAGGLVLVGSTSVTSAAEVIVDGCFTSDYNNYRLVFNGTGSSNNANTQAVRLRFRSSGSDYSTSVYYDNQIYSTNSGGPSRSYAGLTSRMTVGWAGDMVSNITADIVNPQASAKTGSSASCSAWASGGSISGAGWSLVDTTDSFSGVKIYVESGTMTGTLRVYGYAQ